MESAGVQKWIWFSIAIVAAVLCVLLVKLYIIIQEKRDLLARDANSWIRSSPVYLIFGAIVCEMILVYAYIQLFTMALVRSTYSIIVISSITLVTLFSVFIFKEPLPLWKWLGFILAIIAVVLIAI